MRFAALVLAASLIAACGSAAATTAAGPAAAVATEAAILVSDGGVMRPMANGARVPLREGFATVRFSSLAAERVDVDVTVLDAAGHRTPAEVRLSYESLDMDHGSLDMQAVAREGGYRGTLEFAMPGAWRLKLRIDRQGGTETVTLVLPQVGY
jgi:hypothetical protein